MTKMKVGGIALTGFGAFLIASKGINFLKFTVDRICDASKWKAYYKAFQKTGRTDMTPPEKEQVNTEPSPASEALKTAIKDSIITATDAYLDTKKGAKKPSEGETEASEAPVFNAISEDEYINDLEYEKCTIKWYTGDDIFVIDDATMNCKEVSDLIGADIIGLFTFTKNENDDYIRYVRNEGTKIDYSIYKFNRNYKKDDDE